MRTPATQTTTTTTTTTTSYSIMPPSSSSSIVATMTACNGAILCVEDERDIHSLSLSSKMGDDDILSIVTDEPHSEDSVARKMAPYSQQQGTESQQKVSTTATTVGVKREEAPPSPKLGSSSDSVVLSDLMKKYPDYDMQSLPPQQQRLHSQQRRVCRFVNYMGRRSPSPPQLAAAAVPQQPKMTLTSAHQQQSLPPPSAHAEVVTRNPTSAPTSYSRPEKKQKTSGHPQLGPSGPSSSSIPTTTATVSSGDSHSMASLDPFPDPTHES